MSERPLSSAEVLEGLKRLAKSRGYTFEVDADGTERLIRPDGTVAMIARPKEPKQS